MCFKIKQAGVTLIELSVTLSMIGILAGFAAPSYSQFITKRTVAGAANLVASFVEDIKMKSIARNEFATISFKTSAKGRGWCMGAVMGKDVACDCMAETPQCVIDSLPAILTNETHKKFGNLKLAFEDGSFSFDPVRGILSDPKSSVSVQIKEQTKNLIVKVIVNATGSISKCSPANEKLIGYPTCI